MIFLKDKIEALKEFVKLCTKLQDSRNLPVVAIRTDHGREFDQDKFINYCEWISFLITFQHQGHCNKTELLRGRIGNWKTQQEQYYKLCT